MKSSFLSLTLLAVAAIGTLSAQSVCAQEQAQRPGARFSYAPNVYKVEQPRMPHGYGAAPSPHAVKQGSMPQSSNFLGLDPSDLQRPAQQQVAARPAATNVASRAFIPKAVPQVAFNPSFGSPFQAPAPAIAQAAPPLHMAAPASHKAPVIAKSNKTARRHVNTAVSGRLASRPRSSQPAMAASYGNGFGYMPGGQLPSRTSGNSNSRNEVYGRFINNK